MSSTEYSPGNWLRKIKNSSCECLLSRMKSCITGNQSKKCQLKDLELLMNIWRRASEQNRDFISYGDMNLGCKRWDTSGYKHSNMADLMKVFMLEENCYQLVDDYTRIRCVNGDIQRSCLDHLTKNMSKDNQKESL